jgi:hypothetical protein
VPHELHEHIEHAAHDHGGHGSLSRWIGITIAILGVLLALSSALLGQARTELVATMVEETGASLRYQTVSTKYRMLQAQLQQLHALLPDPKVIKDCDKEIKTLKAEVKNPDILKEIEALDLETSKVLTTVTPTPDDMLRFAKLIRQHHKEAEASKEWAESYEVAIKIHDRSATWYEFGLLAAEIGIVVASVALLLHNRSAWLAAIVLGLVCMAILGRTFVINRLALHDTEETISKTSERYKHLSNEEGEAAEDEKLLHDVEKWAKETQSGSHQKTPGK